MAASWASQLGCNGGMNHLCMFKCCIAVNFVIFHFGKPCLLSWFPWDCTTPLGKSATTLDYFLRLLCKRMETLPKRHVAACAMYNTLVDTFREKLLMLLDDVEQFFLWVVAAMLD